jgi:hypothetical protein
MVRWFDRRSSAAPEYPVCGKNPARGRLVTEKFIAPCCRAKNNRPAFVAS